MSKKTAILFGALFLSVALAGVAYAHWLEIITIDGFVQTGVLELEPSVTLVCEQEKPVADCEAFVSDYDGTIVMNLLNVYPCLEVTGRITLDNVGTIPAGLEQVRMYVYEDAGDFVWVEGTHPDYEYFLVLVNENGLPGMEEAIQIGVNFGASSHQYDGADPNSIFQIDDGQSAWMDYYIHFDEGIPEDSEFYFWVDFEYWNWNEASEAFNFYYEQVDPTA